MNAITISETLQINAIIWIRSLPDGELGPTRRILEDLDDLSRAGGLPVKEYVVANREELFAILARLAGEAAQGLRPILYFDAHGNADEGLYLAPGNEWASWSELIERLRAINVATNNNLVVVFALCFGLHLYKLVELKKATPAYLFIASSVEVHVGFLEDKTHSFYKQLHETGEFYKAFAATLSKEMTIMNCQGLFLKALAHYVRTQCQGEVLEKRIERSALAILKKHNITNPRPEQLDQARDAARNFLEPSEMLISHYSPLFLIGREPGFTYSDIQQLVEYRKTPT